MGLVRWRIRLIAYGLRIADKRGLGLSQVCDDLNDNNGCISFTAIYHV